MVPEMEVEEAVTVTEVVLVEMAGMVGPLEAVVEDQDTATQALEVLPVTAAEAK
jgi:hypothetical protein